MRLNVVSMPTFGILGTLNLAPLPLDRVFQPLVFVFVTIKDLKYYRLLMFVPGEGGTRPIFGYR